MTEVIELPDHSPNALTMENDRQWFADHPYRCIRLRYFTDGDMPPSVPRPRSSGVLLMLVFCPADGIRFRFSMSTDSDDPPPEKLLSGDSEVDRELAALLLPRMAAGRSTLGDVVDRQVAALADCLRTGARLSDWTWP